MTTLEQLISAGAENCHPLFIGKVNGKNEIVARDVDGTVYLTDAGKVFLGEKEDAEPKRSPRKKKDAVVTDASDDTSPDQEG